jgi:hypothetical protein
MPTEATPEHNAKIAAITFSSVYPCYITKVEKKGRRVDELDEVIRWLTGYSKEQVQAHIDRKSTFQEFFEEAELHPNAALIKGTICGYRIESLENPITRQVRYLDKLVDELAKGRTMEKILRKA